MNENAETLTTWDEQTKRISVVTIFTDDLDVSRRFYEEVFGLPIHFQDDDSVVFQLDSTLLNILRSEAAPEVIEPASVGSITHGSRFLFTMMVDDVDATCEELARRGVELLNGPMDRPWGIRTASFQDPAGHIWEISHRL